MTLAIEFVVKLTVPSMANDINTYNITCNSLNEMKRHDTASDVCITLQIVHRKSLTAFLCGNRAALEITL
jgi:hypothetical protein